MNDEPAILEEFRPFAPAALSSTVPALSSSLLARLRAIPRPNPFMEPREGEEPPTQIGPYRVIAERGRGGMGIVYEAEDPALKRRVAVKVLTASRLADTKARERFVREARTAASLQHDHILPVYAAETPADGPPYIAMPFINGLTLAQRLRSTPPLTPAEIAELIRQVADALAALHAVGIIHRDVKPGNILLDHGRAMLGDFGLALAADAATTLDHFAGTPNYLSPEQVTRPEAVDARSDVYALGATLYECLTGGPPFRGAPLDVLRMAVECEPVPPRQLNRAVPADLQTIALKCLEKDPARRYQTAADLRDDLTRYLQARPIQARPASRSERAAKWVRRNPGPSLALAASTAAAGLLAVLTLLLRDANRDTAAANTALLAAKMESDQAFELSRDALARVVDRMAERLFEVPKAHDLMLESLREAVDLNARLAAMRPNDAAAQERYGNSLNRLGAVQMLCGQLPEAQTTWQRFREAVDQAVARHPNSLPIQLLRHELWASKLTIEAKLENSAAHREAATEARTVVEELAGKYPDEPKVLRLLASDRLQAIIDRRREKNWLAAVQAAEEATAALERWNHAVPGTPDAILLLGFVQVLKARSLLAQGNHPAAAAAANQADLAYSDPALAPVPTRDRDWGLLQVRKVQAEIATAAKQPNADDRHRAVEALLRRQLRDFPEEDALREDLIRTLSARGDLANGSAAQALYQEAHALAAQLAAQAPNVPRYVELKRSLEAKLK